jgi:hypothetical protein
MRASRIASDLTSATFCHSNAAEGDNMIYAHLYGHAV